MAWTDKYNLNLAGATVADELHSDVGAGVLTLAHDTFFGGADFEVYTGSNKSGTKLVEDTDYVVGDEDADYSTQAGKSVYTTLTIINATYQTGALYFNYRTIGDYAEAADMNALKLLVGRKIGLSIYYAGSDDIRVRQGFTHVDDGRQNWIQKAAESVLSGESTMVGWKYITINNAGTIQVRTATGTNAQRPTDAYFQWTGYDHIKQGYYYAANERIIGAVYRVSSSSWYIINCGENGAETGEDSIGSWERVGNVQTVRGFVTAETSCAQAEGSFYVTPILMSSFWPAKLRDGEIPQVSYTATSSGYLHMVYSSGIPSNTGHSDFRLMRGTADSTVRTRRVDFIAVGKWR